MLFIARVPVIPIDTKQHVTLKKLQKVQRLKIIKLM